VLLGAGALEVVVEAVLDDALELLDAAMINVQEASHFLSAYAQRSDLSESMFAQLDQRMSDWMAQARKLRVAPEDLRARWLELQSEQNALQAGLDIEQLKTTEQALFATFTSHAATLTKARTQAAAVLSEQVTASMQLLNMTGGQFVIALSPAAPSAVASPAGTALA
jgi:DNA repair protein RecN (Recombination protein N)